jgi:hypothetical protein
MYVDPKPFATLHPNLTYWLDECLKIGAVAIAGFWTLWNYRKSRTYAQKMELTLNGSTFVQQVDVFCEIQVKLKNLGGSRHLVKQAGSYCEVKAVYPDLHETIVAISTVFTRDSFIEPGEAISDLLLLKLPSNLGQPIWLRLRLRVVSGAIQWDEEDVVRLGTGASSATQS